MEKVLIVIIFYIFTLFPMDVVEADEEFLEDCFRELSISELLRLKHSLEGMETYKNLLRMDEKSKTSNNEENATKIEDAEQSCPTQNCMKPMAMALIGKPRGYHTSTVYHHHHPWQPEEKTTKLQTFFQGSITALAFLAFGGYLLCLIVQAIRSKGTTYFYPVATTAPAASNGVKRIKVYRRGRRGIQKKQQKQELPYPTELAYRDMVYDYII